MSCTLYIVSGGLLRKQQQQLDEDVTSSDDVASDDEVREGYIVSTGHCQIPDVDLWHSSVLPYVKKNTPSLSCSETLAKPDLTYVEVFIYTAICSYIYKTLIKEIACDKRWLSQMVFCHHARLSFYLSSQTIKTHKCA